MNRTSPICLLVCTLLMSAPLLAADPAKTFYAGADISMLPEIEKAGGLYRDNNEAKDAIKIFRDRGTNLFRVRLFLKPSTDFNSSYGATQDLPYVKALGKRIKDAGGTFALDFHYSDTWADPGKQFKPKEWEGLDFDALVKKVHEYTASVLKEMKDADAMPEMVQVGNEITAGIIWPDGKLDDDTPELKAETWKKFATLLAAGCRAVREASTPEHPIKIILHIHGGGKPGRIPQWFFGTLKDCGVAVDYDIAAVSAYPAWGDELGNLKTNLAELTRIIPGKDLLVAETSYPYRQMDVQARYRSAMSWPMTPEGQKQFMQDMTAAIRDVPEGRGIGFMWWYPEAIPTRGLGIWRNGAEGVFDQNGNALPVLDAFKAASSTTN
jgi:arabinogalactan endo-1,4-beta-galactosidase